MIIWLTTIGFSLSVMALASVIGVLAALALASIGAGGLRPLRENGETLRTIVVLALGLAVLGAVSGVAGGMSRESAVGDIIPAALALVGGVAIYVFGADTSKGLISSCSAVAFAISLGVGYAGGAEMRSEGDFARTTHDFCLAELSDPDLLGDDKAYCRFLSVFGETCASAIATGITHNTEVQSKAYTAEQHFNETYGILIANIEAQTRVIRESTSPLGCGFYLFDRRVEPTTKGSRTRTLNIPPSAQKP